MEKLLLFESPFSKSETQTQTPPEAGGGSAISFGILISLEFRFFFMPLLGLQSEHE